MCRLYSQKVKITWFSAEVEFLNQQSVILGMENKVLKQRLDNLAQEQLIKYTVGSPPPPSFSPTNVSAGDVGIVNVAAGARTLRQERDSVTSISNKGTKAKEDWTRNRARHRWLAGADPRRLLEVTGVGGRCGGDAAAWFGVHRDGDLVAGAVNDDEEGWSRGGGFCVLSRRMTIRHFKPRRTAT
ncbi:hypothetical protein SSX86_021017 [Deinandra increscens subsp. villosa]|uniref:Uncharacterized protein n=1 Tax=Deinandra increscens subsp. villosa TaxID=3103831 RepID=A0AAP0GRB5_9ASTR